jgi:hypothetical protein
LQRHQSDKYKKHQVKIYILTYSDLYMKKEVEKEKPKGRFFLVVSIIIGILYLLIGFLFILWGAPGRGALLLVASLFAFLPKKITRVPYWTRFVIIIAVFVVIYIAGQISLYTISHNFINHNMQETFIMDKGELSMIVYNTTNYTSILVGNETKTTEGYFLFINCGITNLGKDSTMISPLYSLVDNKNNTYQGLGFSGYNKYFQNGLEKDVYFVFELPKTAHGLKFYIEDRTGVHVVDLNI